MKNRKTKILKIKGNWNEVLNDCRYTVGKKDLDKEPSESFKKSILLAEHSPIRNIIFKWEWSKIPHWVVVHWVRHKWEKYVQTQRSDRTGVDRHTLPQDCDSNMRCEANIQNLIDTMRKRLCFCSSKETREYAEDLKMSIHDEVGSEEVSDVLVPNCIYRGGCPEQGQCNFYNTFVAKHGAISDLQERYDVYNEDFYKSRGE